MTRMSVSAAREKLAKTINRVRRRKERILLHRRGENVAALVPVEDFELLEELEDRLDVELAKKALAEPGENIPYEEIREELGLK